MMMMGLYGPIIAMINNSLTNSLATTDETTTTPFQLQTDVLTHEFMPP